MCECDLYGTGVKWSPDVLAQMQTVLCGRCISWPGLQTKPHILRTFALNVLTEELLRMSARREAITPALLILRCLLEKWLIHWQFSVPGLQGLSLFSPNALNSPQQIEANGRASTCIQVQAKSVPVSVSWRFFPARAGLLIVPCRVALWQRRRSGAAGLLTLQMFAVRRVTARLRADQFVNTRASRREDFLAGWDDPSTPRWDHLELWNQ